MPPSSPIDFDQLDQNLLLTFDRREEFFSSTCIRVEDKVVYHLHPTKSIMSESYAASRP